MLLAGALTGRACGPQFETTNPIVFHFYQDYDHNSGLVARQTDENIRLWRSMTSDSITDGAVREAVYTSTLEALRETFDRRKSDNQLLKWIIDNEAVELEQFLLTAKTLEQLRAERASAWYYPSDPDDPDGTAAFEEVIAVCDANADGPLADRYALQKVRALMSSRRWQECIDTYRTAYAGTDDTNLFKRMAAGYAAGAYARLGQREKADRMFAEIGDFGSLSRRNGPNERFIYMASLCPESEDLKAALNGYIGYGDAAGNLPYLRLADAALASPAVVNRGDWLFLKAYIEYVYRNNPAGAARLASQARRHTFSTPRMADDARFFEICVRAECGDLRDLPDNADWAINTYGNSDVVWRFLLPALLRQGRVTDALILANCPTDDSVDFPYANIGFQLLVSRSAAEVEAYRKAVSEESTPMAARFGKSVRSDSDFLDDITGTLLLREGDYARAAEYLARVSPRYQKSMNIYKERYLLRDPWFYTLSQAVDSRWDYDTQRLIAGRTRPTASQLHAKLFFAREMLRHEREMRNGADGDARGLARLRHAIGRYNSFNHAWALTQYWLGMSDQGYFHYWYYTGQPEKELSVTDYIPQEPSQLDEISDWFTREVDSALAMLETDEARAAAQLMLRNYRTVARHYPSTVAGRFLASHCDAWTDWL